MFSDVYKPKQKLLNKHPTNSVKNYSTFKNYYFDF